MNLPAPPPAYSAHDQAETRRQTASWLQRARLRGENLELTASELLIMADRVTGDRIALTIESGAWVMTPL